MPFAKYRDFDDCVRRNSDKRDPQAYCAAIERAVKTHKLRKDKHIRVRVGKTHRMEDVERGPI